MANDLFHVALYVTGKDPNDLIKSQIQQNLADGIRHKYFDIQRVGKLWYAWYHADATKKIRTRVANGSTPNN